MSLGGEGELMRSSRSAHEAEGTEIWQYGSTIYLPIKYFYLSRNCLHFCTNPAILLQLGTIGDPEIVSPGIIFY